MVDRVCVVDPHRGMVQLALRAISGLERWRFLPRHGCLKCRGALYARGSTDMQPVLLAAWCLYAPDGVHDSLSAEALSLALNHKLISALLEGLNPVQLADELVDLYRFTAVCCDQKGFSF